MDACAKTGRVPTVDAPAPVQIVAPAIELRRGLVIRSSVRIIPRTYDLRAAASLDSAVIVVRGDNIVIDFAGATLRGLAPEGNPDDARGVAVRIDSGRSVTIMNARIRGYKVAVLARGTRGLRLVENDLSYNWKPRLYSVREHESLADWLSHHKNDTDEWLRFGAAAYLAGVHGGEVRGNRVVQGMEGIMLVRSDSVSLWNNTVSFNSGVGIALYRSSDNVIMHNHADYNVRGYSDGLYSRGQDSADLLMYEQSDRNVVAYNSMTHGGDGVFVWAGQSTMDTGVGGVNDNLFYENDFSFAPANGIEATFSRNTFARNRVTGSDYGMWGGYSFGSAVLDNDFRENRIGVAVEHGQDNRIAGNRFEGGITAIQLWADTIQPSDWQYPRRRDTRSRGYVIERNSITGSRVAMRISNTSDVSIAGNRIANTDTAMVMRDSARIILAPAGDAVDMAPPATWPRPSASPPDVAPLAPLPMRGARSAFGDPLASRDRSAIIVDEWGPFDWRSPRLWPIASARGASVALRVLAPPGEWHITSRRGVGSVSRTHGLGGDTIHVVASNPADWRVDAVYRGAPTTSPRGTQRAAAAAYAFSYERFEPVAVWNVRFFVWNDSTDPRRRPSEFAALLAGPAVAEQRVPRLDYLWSRPTVPNVPATRFALTAISRVALPVGVYTLRTISDDAVRVWVDGRLAIDSWSPHESLVDAAPLTGGIHHLRVEYFQVDGWTELRLDIVRGRQRAGGSPGPH